VKKDIELAVLVRVERDTLHERAQDLALLPGYPLGSGFSWGRRPASNITRRHRGVQQHQIFLRTGEQGFQLLAPCRQLGEIVPDL
jgi:hypothetical protein